MDAINPRPKIMLNINPEILDELLKEYTNPQDLIGENGILKQLTKAIVERCLNTEMAVHLESNESGPAFIQSQSPSEQSDRLGPKDAEEVRESGGKIDEMERVKRR